jgi:hypothetical protein
MFEYNNEINFLHPREINQLLASADNLRHRLIILLMLDCGLRVTETITLKIGDFDYKRRLVRVNSLKKRGKNQVRSIPLSDRLYKTLADYLYAYKNPEPDKYLFPSPLTHRTHIERQAVNNFLYRIRKKKLPIKRLHPHSLRHTFATQHISKGTPLENIKTMLGHKSYDTTLIYAQIPDEILRRNIQNVTTGNRSLAKRWLDKIFQTDSRVINIQKPSERNFLIGRVEDLSKLNALVSKNVNVILTGGIGVGKSTLLDNIQTDRKILIFDDTSNLKKSLVYLLVYLLGNDKEAIRELIFKDFDLEKIRVKLNRENVFNLCDEISRIVDPHEYILKINNVDNITPKAVRVLEHLKDTFTIITTAREIPLSRGSFLWNFERIEIKNLNRFESLQLIQKLSYDLEIEDYDLFKNHVFEQSDGNPRVIFELIDRYKKEPFILNETVRNIRHTGALREYDFSMVIILAIGCLAVFRYLNSELDNASYRFIGGAALVLLIISRNIFSRTKRKFI